MKIERINHVVNDNDFCRSFDTANSNKSITDTNPITLQQIKKKIVII